MPEDGKGGTSGDNADATKDDKKDVTFTQADLDNAVAAGLPIHSCLWLRQSFANSVKLYDGRILRWNWPIRCGSLVPPFKRGEQVAVQHSVRGVGLQDSASRAALRGSVDLPPPAVSL